MENTDINIFESAFITLLKTPHQFLGFFRGKALTVKINSNRGLVKIYPKGQTGAILYCINRSFKCHLGESFLLQGCIKRPAEELYRKKLIQNPINISNYVTKARDASVLCGIWIIFVESTAVWPFQQRPSRCSREQYVSALLSTLQPISFSVGFHCFA